MNLSYLDGISERLIGWGCVGAAVTECVSPQLLAIDLTQAGGLGVFGFLIATGRADAAVRKIRRLLSDD